MVDPGPLVAGVLVAAVGGYVGLRKARGNWRIRAEIKSARDVRAGALRPGVVELEGTVVPAAETFTAPLTGRECVAYRYRVEEKHRKRRSEGGGKKTVWRERVDKERAAPFYVDDGSGRALVDAPVAEFELEEAHGVEAADGEVEPLGGLTSMLTGGGHDDLPVSETVKAEAERASKDRRYYEHLIFPDESVYVYGEAMPPEEARAEGSGLSTLAGLFGSSGASGPGLLGTLVGIGGDTTEYRRASRRDPEPPDPGSEDVPDFESAREEIRQRQQRLEELEGKDPEEMTPEERRRLQSEVEEMMSEFGKPPDSLRSGLGDAAAATVGTDDGPDPFADERLVVSRGEAIGEFVVSDHEKGTVVRAYTKGTLKWLAVALACVAFGAYLVAVAFGYVGPWPTR